MDNNKFDLSNFKDIQNRIKEMTNNIKIEIPQIPTVNYENITKVDTKSLDDTFKEIQRMRREDRKREIENNESLKNIVNYNEQLVNYNKQLVSLNESILKKINVINDSIEVIIESVKENTDNLKQSSIEHNALLLELINIMESKDNSNKLTEFLSGLSGNVAAGLIVEYLKMKLSL